MKWKFLGILAAASALYAFGAFFVSAASHPVNTCSTDKPVWCQSKNICVATAAECTTAGSSCTSPQWWCQSKSKCVTSASECDGTMQCPSDKPMWCQSKNMCVTTATECTSTGTSCQSPQWWCQSKSKCVTSASECDGGGDTTQCTSGQMKCWDTTGKAYCTNDTKCPMNCTSGQMKCKDKMGYDYCDYGTSCPSYDGGDSGDQKRHEEERRRMEEEQKRRYEEEERRFRDEENRRRGQDDRMRKEDDERMKREEQMNFEGRRRGLKQFSREIERMQSEADRARSRFEKCQLSFPSELGSMLEKARGLASKVDSAKNAGELQSVEYDMQDVGYLMQDWGQKMGPLQQVCEMLTNAQRELDRLVQDQDRLAERAKSRNVNIGSAIGKLRELSRKMSEVLTEAKNLASKDPDKAVFMIEDKVFYRMEDYHNAQREAEMAIDVRQGLKDADRELDDFKNRIDDLREQRKDTKSLDRSMQKLVDFKRKMESLSSQGKLDERSMGDLRDDVFASRDELISKLNHLEGGKRFLSEDNRTTEYKSELPEEYRPTARTKVIREAVDEGANADGQIKEIKEKAQLLGGDKLDTILSELNLLRSQVKEQQAEIKYLKNLTAEFSDLSKAMQEKLNTFVTYGVDANSQKLGAGERAAVLNSYKAAYQALPEDEQGLEDIIKIVNGRFPSQRSPVAEKQAKRTFTQIFKRVANMKNENDKAAIMVMAYGLRQSAKNRNLESENQGIKTFRSIFNSVPTTTEEWNTMQAITYSGAKRKTDTDKDLLSDEDEKLLGTDPSSPDTDGDGVEDGEEVDEEFDPLKKLTSLRESLGMSSLAKR